MTPIQARYLRTLASLTRKRGFAPTVRELCEALGVSSTNAVNEMLGKLQKAGLISRERLVARSTLLTSAGRKEVGL